MWNNSMRVWVAKEPGYDVTNIFLVEGYQDGCSLVVEPKCVNGEILWERRKVPGGEKIKPIFSVSGFYAKDFLQLLVDTIYEEFKIHAKDAEPESLHLAAVNDHLNDLKRLVFEETLREVKRN
uniref:Uncharacterized protein n=1 Tax=viral metagenome TaxID=1070528 RepID=A0A6M3JXX3_9ZZZZ